MLDELRKSDGTLSDETRFRLAAEAFRRTAQYDAAIAAYLRDPAAAGRPAPAGGFPERLAIDGVRVQSLRYGENPHQAAAFYRPAAGALGSERGRASSTGPSSPTTTCSTGRPRSGCCSSSTTRPRW